jgi:hypothetical protein
LRIATGNQQMKHKLTPIQAVILLLPMLTVAVTAVLYRFGPPVWRLYVLYSIAMLTHPMIMLFLILSLLSLGVAVIVRRRHTSELLAFCFLLSAVLHLLTVAFFSLWIVQQHPVEFEEDEGRVAVGSGVPRLSEGMVGEELRSMLQDLGIEDERELDERVRTEGGAEEPVEYEQRDVDAPERSKRPAHRDDIAVESSEANREIEAALRKLESRLSSRDTSKLVRFEELEVSEEVQAPEPPSARQVEDIARDHSFKPSEEPVEVPEAALPEVMPDPQSRAEMDVADLERREQPVAETLEKHDTAHAVEELPLPVEVAETEDAAPESPVAGPIERTVADEKHQSASRAKDAPAVARSEREVPTSIERASALGADAEQPALSHASRSVTDQTTDTAPWQDRETVDLDVAALPVETQAPGPPQEVVPMPRSVATDRVEYRREVVQPTDAPLAVEVPDVRQVPTESRVEKVRTAARAEPTLTETLVQQVAAEFTMAPERVLRQTVEQVAVQDEPSRKVDPARPRDVRVAHSAGQVNQTMPTREDAAYPAQLPGPVARGATSLADARRARTASPMAETPSVADPVRITAKPGKAAAVTINIGGRLLLVEPSERSETLDPAPLSVRDVLVAYRSGEQPSDSVPASVEQMAPAPSKVSPVSRESISVSDSVRMLPAAGAPLRVESRLSERDSSMSGQVSKLAAAAVAITTPVTGVVSQVQVVTDVRAFTEGRVTGQRREAVAMRPVAEAAVLEPGAVSATPSSLERTSVTSPMSRQGPPVAEDQIVVAVSRVAKSPLQAHAAGSVSRMTVASGGAAAAKPAQGSERSVALTRHSAASVSKVDATVAPRAPGHAVKVAVQRAPVREWRVERPVVEGRTALVVADAASRKSGQPGQARVDAIVPEMAAVGVSQATSTERRVAPSARSAQQSLAVGRVARSGGASTLGEEGIPPPRTTFIGMAARTAPVLPRVGGVGVPSGVSSQDRRATSDEGLVDVATRGVGRASLEVAAAGMIAAAQASGREGGPKPAGGGTDAPVERVRSFAVDRASAGRVGEAPVSVGRPGIDLPRSETPGRGHARSEMSSVAVGSDRATVSDDVVSDDRDSLRSLISAEIAASRESPSRKAIYQLRHPSKRKQYISELGGSAETESAVEAALSWLASAQSRDGRWDVDGFEGAESCGGRGNQPDADVGITGFTLLAFLGAGYTHMGGEHESVARRAIDWLIDGMEPNGDLRRGGQMYDQAMATTALCEALSLTGDTRLRGPAEKAVQFILDSQNPGAAWRYDPRVDNDTSVTGWQILALKSAEVAGIKVPRQHYHWTQLWLDEVRRGEQGGLYLYRSGHAVTPVMTAEGWFCQLFMGEKAKTRGQEESMAYVMQHLPVWSTDIPGAINFYYWYYATLALHLSGSEAFGTWNDALTTALMEGRVKEGPAAGTWDPVSHVGIRGGRIYSTAVATLCLEVYYRFLPFYKLQ